MKEEILEELRSGFTKSCGTEAKESRPKTGDQEMKVQ